MSALICRAAAAPGEISIDRAEVLRYLGYGREIPGQEAAALIEACIREVEGALDCRACSLRVPVTQTADEIGLGPLAVRSVSLRRHLAGCREAVLFVATVGLAVDRIIYTHSRLSPSRAVAAQAAGAAAIEAWCDRLCADLAVRAAEHGCVLRSRFSPGYGDFSLETQRALLTLLDAGRQIGVTLTDGLMMLPGKSVSAVVGIAPADKNDSPNRSTQP